MALHWEERQNWEERHDRKLSRLENAILCVFFAVLTLGYLMVLLFQAVSFLRVLKEAMLGT